MRTRAMRRVRARYTWDRLKVSFWFAPAIMSLAAILLAWVMYWLDGLVPNDLLATSRFILTGSVSELRGYLLAMAVTVLATAGVVFTLLTLPLSTVVAQYGSRLLRLFLGDRITQFVLGMFVATFVYCAFAALSISGDTAESEGPQITATIGLFLMIATFASLILLLQHITTMLQAPNIAAAAAAELLDVIGAEFSDEGTSHNNPSPDVPLADGLSRRKAQDALLETAGYPLRVREIGYIQAIDPQILFTLAQEKDLIIRLLHNPGYYVWSGVAVALVWPADRVDEELDQQICQAIQIGNGRTPTQDVAYAVNQLVEMAVRAMSPAINDPFTAMTCLDYLGTGLALFVQQGEENLNTYDQEGRLRLVFEPVTFDELLRGAFDMIRHASCDNATVLLHMLAVIDTINEETKSPEVRQGLFHYVSLIQAESQAGALIEADRQIIRLSGEALQKKLKDSVVDTLASG